MDLSQLQDKKAQIRNEYGQKLRELRRQMDQEFEKKKSEMQDQSNLIIEQTQVKKRDDLTKGQAQKHKRIEDQKSKI